jgi:hypothetical protein
MKKLLFVIPLMLASLMLPSKADTLFTADSVSVVGGQNVTLLTPHLVNASVGEIKLHNNASNTDVLVWCLDVFDSINLPYTYTVSTYNAGDVKPGIQTLNAAQVRQIAGLMLLGNTMFSNAAVQLAIWRVEYGALFSSNASGALLADSVSAFNDSVVGGLLDCSHCQLTVYTDAPVNPSQAFGSATLLAVPGPIAGAGIPGMIAACGMLVAFARRRRSLAA